MPNMMPNSLGPCPCCGGKVEPNEGAWACEDCGLRYPYLVVATCWKQFLHVSHILEQDNQLGMMTLAEAQVIPGLRRCCICGCGFVKGQHPNGAELRFCYGCGFALPTEAWEHRAELGAYVRAKVAKGPELQEEPMSIDQSLDKLKGLLGPEFERYL